MSIDITRFYQVFFDEAADHLGTMEGLLLELDPTATDRETLDAIFRAAHSIKGGAGTFGFVDMAELTHVMETLLDRLRKGESRPTDEMVDACLQATDVLKGQLAAHQQGVEHADPDAERVRQWLGRLAQAPEKERLGATEQLGPPPAVPDPDLSSACSSGARVQSVDDQETEIEGFGLFATDDQASEIEGFGLFSADAQDTEIEEQTAAAPHETWQAQQEAAQGYGFFAPLAAPAPATAGAAEPADRAAIAAGPLPTAAAGAESAAKRPGIRDASIRVSVEKVDQLINLVGELVITHAMLAESAGVLDPVLHERLFQGLTSLDRNSRDLQQAVMSIRMLPISFVFNRFPRLVRDTAASLGKRVRLTLSGQETELDKGLIEQLADPLTHLVRNAIDHGIESPERRLAAGKPETGEIQLRASHRGGSVVVEVQDDGAGLNPQRLRDKAQRLGIPLPEDPSDKALWQLIFQPGFSTAETITDLSGRGVGMDVVRRNIEAMQGRVDIESAPGIGTLISIRLPLTLAILDGLSVRVGEEIFILPLTTIKESIQPRPDHLKTVSGRGRLVRIDGDYLPVIVLREVFGQGRQASWGSEGILVVVDTSEGRAALLVDELISQHQVVIKSLETNYRRVEGLAGATIMGDGRVALILDADALVRLGRQAA